MIVANPGMFPQYGEIKDAICRLPIRREEAWQVSHLTDYLAIMGNIIAERGGDGAVPPHFRAAIVETIENELNGLVERASKLAHKIEKSGGTKRAREQLALHVRGLHGPTMTALSDVDAVVIDGRQVLADMAYFASGFPEKLENGGAVSVQELRFWTGIAALAKNVPLKPRNEGRPPDRLAQAVASALARGYLNLTWKEPKFSTIVGKEGEGTVYGTFLDLVREIFGILNIKHDPIYYASIAAHKLRGRGRKK